MSNYYEENLDNPFKLPSGIHVCKSCKKDWIADYEVYEEIICPYCEEEQDEIRE